MQNTSWYFKQKHQAPGSSVGRIFKVLFYILMKCDTINGTGNLFIF